MRTVVIVLLDPTSDAQLGLVEVWHSLSHTSSSFRLRWNRVAVALGMVVGRAAVRNAQPV
jgi:hypothetical protein